MVKSVIPRERTEEAKPVNGKENIKNALIEYI
jgi:hypothetical protein